MSDASFNPESMGSSDPPQPELVVPRRSSFARRLPRLICSQNPFYLLSVCFVIHGTAQWFHPDNGGSFSPWPLLGLITGYIAVLASTGFVIVRLGKVWDDARSILLLILLLFVELSLIFDETLVRDPQAGRWLLLAGLSFSMVLSELLLCGLRIRLPWRFRVPYHALLCLLFLYPFWLVVPGVRLAAETVGWRVLQFPVAAALILLTMLPAIRRGPEYTRDSGTPWLWPWYPWSLFVFLGMCVGFRAYSLTLSFDAVLGSSLEQALAFDSIFGSYFLVPMVFATGVLLLEIGLVSRFEGPVRLAMLVPLLGLYLSQPSTMTSGAYEEFLSRLVRDCGSPIWLTLIAATFFYGHALIRGVKSAEFLLIMTLLIATRVDATTIHWLVPAAPQSWPLVALAAVELMLGLKRWGSHRVFAGLTFAIIVLHLELRSHHHAGQLAMPCLAWLAAVLFVGAIFRDEFARLLRVAGAPLIVIAVLSSIATAHLSQTLPAWSVQAAGLMLMGVAIGYGWIVRMKVYRLAAYLTGCLGMAELAVRMTVVVIHDSRWVGAWSFAAGLGWFFIAVAISSWKAGWLQGLATHLQALFTFESEAAPAPP